MAFLLLYRHAFFSAAAQFEWTIAGTKDTNGPSKIKLFRFHEHSIQWNQMEIYALLLINFMFDVLLFY